MIIIKNGTLVRDCEFQADLAVEGKQILKIAETIEPGPGDRVIDASGCYVFPGFIDAHTHFQMKNAITTTADSFETGTKAAVMGGTTTIINFASPVKGGTLYDAYNESMKKAEGHCSSNFRFHMEIIDMNSSIASEIVRMPSLGVTSFKVYLAYDFRLDDAAVYSCLKAVKKAKGLLGVHCENGDILKVKAAELKASGELTPASHPKAHPAEAEAEAISRLAYIGKLVGYPVHVVHLSSYAGLAEIRKARGMGIEITAETCPQYLVLDESRYNLPGFESAKYVMSPPLRSISDQTALLQAIRRGDIQTIATDHCSYNYADQKSLGRDDFTKIPGGAPGVEHRVPLMYTRLVHDGLISIEKFVALLSENPAKMYGMYPWKGLLAEGSDADIVIYRKDGTHVIEAARQTQNVDYTPYEGMSVQGSVRDVLVNGVPVVENGMLTHPYMGTYVH